ncbi:MAG: hypothetical protein ACJ790_12205 [Myxococcaceae bacterium]
MPSQILSAQPVLFERAKRHVVVRFDSAQRCFVLAMQNETTQKPCPVARAMKAVASLFR